MTAADSAAIQKLVDFMPLFESGDEPSTNNWFMDFYRLASEEFEDRDYQKNMERFGDWEGLKDLDFIRRAGIDNLKTVLTAACRSEYWGSADFSGSIWREYHEAGTFTAALQRLAELEGRK